MFHLLLISLFLCLFYSLPHPTQGSRLGSRLGSHMSSHVVTLPQDDAVLVPSEMQWWYWTGFLDSHQLHESADSPSHSHGPQYQRDRSGDNLNNSLTSSSSSLSFTVDYGFECCVFLVGDDIQVVHIAVTDVKNDSFIFQESVELKRPTRLNSSFEFKSSLGTSYIIK